MVSLSFDLWKKFHFEAAPWEVTVKGRFMRDLGGEVKKWILRQNFRFSQIFSRHHLWFWNASEWTLGSAWAFLRSKKHTRRSLKYIWRKSNKKIFFRFFRDFGKDFKAFWPIPLKKWRMSDLNSIVRKKQRL